ncbi:phage baseplate assembly protein V [Paracidovorax valerianellae]|uniref:phage baseplate assembly protein V n=1 Tax=Paracidovorax valerianellae TaxID=187868 RepID=UPI002303D199|nr:phage baseplate assembly protein V [Paracidovorax valerianellae]MDA8444760.1 phage baseplate assembly protein V [Paracidovorax valerianellae]
MPYETPQQDSPQEAARRIENLARMGTVMAVRHAKPARCRVHVGENTTDWLPWLAGRAAGKKGSDWWPPVVGEQCLVIAPGGDLAQGVVLLGAYSDQMDAPSDEAGVSRRQWTEREWAEYRQQQYTVHTESRIVLEAGAGCRITMAPDGITLQVGGAVLHIGPDRITSTVDIVAQGVSAVEHVHSGVRVGNDNTQVPVR